MKKKSFTYIKAGITGPDVRLHGYDHFGRNIYVPRCFIYKERLDEDKIQKALVAMMPSFPLLTGRIVKDDGGYLVVRQNDLGMRFEVKTSNENYKDYSAEDNFSKKAQSHVFFRLTAVDKKDAPIVTVTITHFKDRGSVFGYSNLHSVMDGQSNIYFLTSLIKIINGEALPDFKFDRTLLAFDAYDFSHLKEHKAVIIKSKWQMAKMYLKFVQGIAFANQSKMMKIDGSILSKLKAYGLNQPEPTVSTMDLLAAILWKTVATVRKEKKVPLFNYTINLRFKTSLDQYYIGNASTGHQLYDNDLLNKSIVDIARFIRAGLAEIDDESGAKEAQFLNQLVLDKKIGSAVQKELSEIVDGGAIMFNSTYKYPFYSLDFGTGTPTWYDMPPGPLNGIFYTIPDADGKSINLGFGIAKNEMKQFLELFHKALSEFR